MSALIWPKLDSFSKSNEIKSSTIIRQIFKLVCKTKIWSKLNNLQTINPLSQWGRYPQIVAYILQLHSIPNLSILSQLYLFSN